MYKNCSEHGCSFCPPNIKLSRATLLKLKACIQKRSDIYPIPTQSLLDDKSKVKLLLLYFINVPFHRYPENYSHLNLPLQFSFVCIWLFECPIYVYIRCIWSKSWGLNMFVWVLLNNNFNLLNFSYALFIVRILNHIGNIIWKPFIERQNSVMIEFVVAIFR